MVKVAYAGSGRVSLAGIVALKPGENPRLIYRTITHRGRKGERKGFAEHDYARLLDDAHQQLHAPIVLVWDNLNTHKSALMRRLIAARNWLTVFYLPSYAPEYNPVEGVWAHMKTSLEPRQTHPRPARRPGQIPATTHSIPPGTHQRTHRQDRPGSSTSSNPRPSTSLGIG